MNAITIYLKQSLATIICSCFLVFIAHAQIITTYAGGGTNGLGDGGLATNAHLGVTGGIAFDTLGNLFIADPNDNRIRKVDAITNIITTFAGNGNLGFSGDSGLAINATFNGISYLAVDNKNNLYVSDFNNNRIRRINISTGVITTIVGKGISGYGGDNGPARFALLDGPAGICFDKFGNFYISDLNNYVIRKVDTFGIITTYVGIGTPGFSGDNGEADSAQIWDTQQMTIDSFGDLIIADIGNNRVRKIDFNTHIISTVAGYGNYLYNGDGISATNAGMDPYAVAFDPSGNLFIADHDNQRIRKIDASGIINTVAGNGNLGFSGDNGIADSAEFHFPIDVIFDKCGNLYISDNANNRIRKVTFDTSCGTTTVQKISLNNTISLYPNPIENELTITNAPLGTSIRVYDVVGRLVFNSTLNAKKESINTSAWERGTYFIEMILPDGTKEIRKIVK
jgi:sugar lactone lactonase YvrE